MRWDVINELLGVTKRRRYLEIGCQYGRCGERVRADERHGVDPNPLRNCRRVYPAGFFRGTSDEFFQGLKPGARWDVVLVDGLHHGEQVLRDVDHVLEHLAEDGWIVLHDCNPASEIAQRVPRAIGQWNGDCWRAMAALRKRPDLDAFTIDADEGIGVVRRKPGTAPAVAADVPAETWDDLVDNRQALLGLVPPASWQERAGEPLALGRLVVVTANFGGRDRVPPAPAADCDADAWLLFTDDPTPVPGWELRLQEVTEASPRLQARWVKTLALELVPDADVVVWVDGRIEVQARPLRPFLRQVLRGADVGVYPHPWRDCAYAEAKDCAELKRAPEKVLEAQAAHYRAQGLPAGAGLWNTMALARRRTPQTEALGRAWWDEVRERSVRDQVSLPFLLWRDGIQVSKMGRCVYQRGVSPYFRLSGAHAGGGA